MLHNCPTSAAFMPTNEKRVASTNMHFFRWPKRIPAYERRERTIKINSSWPTTTQRPLEIFPHPLSSFFLLLSLLFPHPQRILSVFLSVLSLSLSSSYILYHNDSNYSPSTGPSCCFYCCKFYCEVAGVKSFISLKEDEQEKKKKKNSEMWCFRNMLCEKWSIWHLYYFEIPFMLFSRQLLSWCLNSRVFSVVWITFELSLV